MPIRTVLISVSDKTGLEDFARGLAGLGAKILSTGGTARFLREAGVEVEDVSTYTGAPELLDGRVKTLHPRVHAGILARRDQEHHLQQLAEHSIDPIDMVVVNLYPFERGVQADECTREEALELVDIGGPTLLRAAAKCHEHVLVVCDPADYDEVLGGVQEGEGAVTSALRERLALKAFERTCSYDRAIARWFRSRLDPESGVVPTADLVADFESRGRPLRYGENPHQSAFVVRSSGAAGPIGAAGAKLLWGKELSYNNLLDLDAALELVRELPAPGAVVVKHSTPCGAGIGPATRDSFDVAYAGDPLSAFGGIVALNTPVDLETARAIADRRKFLEALIAPGYEKDALAVLEKGPKWCQRMRVLEVPSRVAGGSDRLDPPAPAGVVIRSLQGALLCQTRDAEDEREDRVVTQREPSTEERAALDLAWTIVKHVKSNAITLVKGPGLVGVGGGQTSRVDAVEIAARKAGERARGAVMASDAFFPFPDGIEAAARAGVRAVIQPGGSVRDDAVVEAADRLGLAMVMTGVRHFRH